jgi:hypothetical protein
VLTGAAWHRPSITRLGMNMPMAIVVRGGIWSACARSSRQRCATKAKGERPWVRQTRLIGVT